MRQFSYSFDTDKDFNDILGRIKKEEGFDKASDLLFIAAIGDQKPEFAESLISSFNETIGRGSFIGYTSADVISDGLFEEGKNSLAVMLFESSHVKVISCDTRDVSAEEGGKKVSEAIEEDKECRALMLLPDVYHVERLDLFLSSLKFSDPDFPVCGASAGGVWRDGGFSPMFVFTDHILSGGIISILFSGSKLHAKTEALRGWSPVGKGHTVTKLSAPQVVAEIDDMPAAYVYKKYFNLEPDSYFIQNLLGFPWVLKRSGELLPRSILALGENQSLVFASDINEGEKFHFSYGNVTEMLKGTLETVKGLIPFSPEAVYLMVCDYRKEHLGPEQQKEIDFFKNAFPSVAGSGAFGEFFHIGNKVEAFNCTVLALALREGDAKDIADSTSKLLSLPAAGVVPIQDRLFTFLKETSIEYSTLRARERERELQNRIEVEHAASEAKSEFLSNVSHEIRTPINAILGMNEMILREAAEEKILGYSKDIRSAGNALLSLVNDILDFSKIEAGKLEVVPVEYSLSSLLNDLVNMITPLANKKRIKIILDYDENTPDRLNGDIVRIRQVLVNLMNNAVKFTDEGYVKLTVNFKKISANAIGLEFHCIDTGVGIKEEDMPKLFSPFERVDDSNKARIEGTGLGMSISRNLLEIMHSKLEVKSEFGKGSDFSFVIKQMVFSFDPVGSYMKDSRERGVTERVTKETFHAPEALILIVDDMEMNLSVAKNLLKRTQVNIETALSGQEAINLAMEKKYDIIFMDHRMPGMEGTEAMKRIRALPKGSPNDDTPIIVLTANAVAGSREKFLAEGFNGYIPKPIDPDMLERTIRKLLPPEKVTTVVEEVEETSGYSSLTPFLKSLISVPEIDVPAGITACGDTSTYEKVLEEFMRTSMDKAKIIRNDIIEEDYKDYTIRVHSLKSTARLVGATSLSRHAAYLEKCGDALRTEEIIKKTPVLLREYRNIAKIIEDNFPEEDDSEKELITKDMLKEAYQAIYECVIAFDFDGADNVMEELKKYRIPDDEKPRFEELSLLLTNVDHDGIAAMFKENS